jgi:Flp pilus assembly protein TadG
VVYIPPGNGTTLTTGQTEKKSCTYARQLRTALIKEIRGKNTNLSQAFPQATTQYTIHPATCTD